MKLVVDLFEDWQRMFGAKLQERQNIDKRTAQLWAIALKLLKITPNEFKQAWAISLTMEWPPTAAEDFVSLVRDEVKSQYPDAQTAFDIACKNCGMDAQLRRWNKTHVVVYQTANELGFGKLKTATHGLLKTFTDIYNRVCTDHANGADFALPESHQLGYDDTHKPASADSPVMTQWDKMVAEKRRRKEATV